MNPLNENLVHEIVPFLYLSRVEPVNDPSMLERLGIRLVLSVCRPEEKPKQVTVVQAEYAYIPADDDYETDLFKFFPWATDLIASFHAKNQAVLVHCVAGASRSATIVVAFLMRHKGWSLNRALLHTKRKRDIVEPNVAFIRQLRLWETACNTQRGA